MRRTATFLLMLLSGLAALAWITSLVTTRTTQAWFMRDLTLRSQLAIDSARESLIARWDEPARLRETLTTLALDERIMAVAACAASGRDVAATEGFPVDLACSRVGAGAPFVAELPTGRVHVSARPVDDRGYVVVVHDMSFADRRDASTRRALLFAFGVLAVSASALTVLVIRLSWRRWTTRLKRALREESHDGEFQPILGDLRDFALRLAAARDLDKDGVSWTPKQLKHVLSQQLDGEQIVIVSNREPYIHERGADGEVRVVHPASGLVTALEPVMRACSGVWVAHGSGSADREVVDARARVRVPPDEESYVLRRVWLDRAEEDGYYYGFANEGLWPLCHVAHTRPTFRAEDFRHYQAINRRFADAVCDEATGDDPIILVQDYHLALAPRMIRERLPRATILAFWHIPWPNHERVGICPWRDELLHGMLGASILGFHTQQHCNHFVDAIDTYLEARIDAEEQAIVQGNHRTLVRAFPISIEWPVKWMRDVAPVDVCRAEIFAELGLPEDALLGVGVDRLDYTKGIEERLLAVERLLEKTPELRGRFSFVQLAAPSRTQIERYRELNEATERTAERINRAFASGAYKPIILLRAHHEPPTVYRFYRAADVCYVSSLHDGMNLVAKEFVAARDDEQGVLVLSQFTGAARELTEALVVNPYDIDQAAAALRAALTMPKSEQRERMHAMRVLVQRFNVYRWAGRMLIEAAELRRRERLTGRLQHWTNGARAWA